MFKRVLALERPKPLTCTIIESFEAYLTFLVSSCNIVCLLVWRYVVIGNLIIS